MEFAELRMLWLDMEHARALFERLAEMPDLIGDFRLSFALWTSGVIAYRRCFTDGEGLERGRGRRLVPQRFIDALDPGRASYTSTRWTWRTDSSRPVSATTTRWSCGSRSTTDHLREYKMSRPGSSRAERVPTTHSSSQPWRSTSLTNSTGV